MSDIPLGQVLYRSLASASLSDDALSHMLAQARERNTAEGLSGLLVYQRGRFVQWLEGPQQALQRVWASIQRDPRHTQIEQLYVPWRRDRLFPDWRMQFSTDGSSSDLLDPEQVTLPPDSLRELRSRDADVQAIVHGIALWHQLPSPEAMAATLARGAQEEVQALCARVAAGRPAWRAVGWHLLGPVSRALGDAWQQDRLEGAELSIAQSRLQALLREVGATHSATHPDNAERSVVVAPLPGEPDLAGVTFAGVALDAVGWRVNCVFPKSVGELVQTVAEAPHDVLHLALSDAFRREQRLADLADAIRAVRRAAANPQLQVLVSGRAFIEQPGLAVLVGADGDGLAQGSEGRDLDAMLAWARIRTGSPGMLVAQASLLDLGRRIQRHHAGHSAPPEETDGGAAT
jgi:Sensors of blue-light using FAD